MPAAATASGGKPKRKRSARKPAKKTAGTKTLEQVKKEAKKLSIPLSKDGKAKTKAQLQRAIASRKH